MTCSDRSIYARIYNRYDLQLSRRPGDSLWSRDGNLGDCIQNIAVEEAYEKIGIAKKKDLLRINRDDISKYSGQPCTLFMQGWFGNYAGSFPLPWSKNINPVFIGFHLSSIYDTRSLFIKKGIHKLMIPHQPIGCRDRNTRDFLKKLGLNAYFSGCMTLTLDKRTCAPDKKEEKVFVVDLDPKIQKKLTPEIIRKNLDGNIIDYTITHFYYWNEYPVTEKGAQEFEEHARYVLNKYKNEAKLVITSKIHVAMPCIAMGIPVIFIVGDPFGERFDVLSGIVPIYSAKDIKYIDWHPIAPNIEPLKQAILSNVKAIFSKKDELISKSISELDKITSHLVCNNPIPKRIRFARTITYYLKTQTRGIRKNLKARMISCFKSI